MTIEKTEPENSAVTNDDEDKQVRRDQFAGPEGQQEPALPVHTDGAEISGTKKVDEKDCKTGCGTK